MQFFGIFAIIGTISFSMQGGLIAIEKKYDLFSVYIFGIITAFGGGLLRHVIIGESDYDLWNQHGLFYVAVATVTFVLLTPKLFFKSRPFWTSILDVVGVIAFAIDGSLAALNMDLPASAVIVAAMLTAMGGGIFRDILSQRKPIFLSENIYSVWIFLIGLIIGMRWATANVHLIVLFIVFTTLRLVSYFRDWKIPYRHF